MTPDEIEAALQAAFNRCELTSCPLTDSQKRILLQVVEQLTTKQQELLNNGTLESNDRNPLDELTPEERQGVLQFIQEQEQQNRPWKIQLLNDWLHERNSGKIQFIRDRYGVQWVNRIEPFHVAEYAKIEAEETLRLKVGDRIEVSNGLWEWVQETGPCKREWILCTVIQVGESSCIVRFNNGAEYEIQGVYQWNRYNWRWATKK